MRMFKRQKIKVRSVLVVSSALLLAGLFLMPKTPVLASDAAHLPIYFAQDGVVDVGGGGDAAPAPEGATDSGGGGRRAALARDCNDKNLTQGNCKIVKYIITFINVLSAVVGVIVVIMIVVGGIQYSASRDNPQATAAAKGRIINALIALLFYLFAFAFLQWLVPGGVFSS